MATYKTQQLNVDLSSISDPAVRAAFTTVMQFVNGTTQAVRTNKSVKGNFLSNNIGNAKLDSDGVVHGTGIDLLEQGVLKWSIHFGSLGSTAARTIHVNGIIMGCIGWTQVGGGSEWNPLRVAAGDGIAFTVTTATDTNSVRLLNGEALTNAYRLIIFYMER